MFKGESPHLLLIPSLNIPNVGRSLHCGGKSRCSAAFSRVWSQNEYTSSVMSQIVHTWGCVGHKISIATIQCCCYSMKAAVDNAKMNVLDWAPKFEFYIIFMCHKILPSLCFLSTVWNQEIHYSLAGHTNTSRGDRICLWAIVCQPLCYSISIVF